MVVVTDQRYFQGNSATENGSKNSVLNWALKLNLDQQTFENTTNTTFSRDFQLLYFLVIQIKFFLINKNKCEPILLLPTWILIARKLYLPL